MLPRKWRWLQLLLGVHRIHHIRFGFGWKLPFVGVTYFPPGRVRDSDQPSGWFTFHYGWRRVKSSEYHDCTWTGRY